jgi:DNA adenine methylase
MPDFCYNAAFVVRSYAKDGPIHGEDDYLRPFLKWAGNKHRILERVLSQLPDGDRLVEPFVGSGAVFLNAQFEQNILADTNADLIHLYRILQEEGDKFIPYAARYLQAKYNNRESFERLREQFNTTRSKRLKAALFIYLNRHGFNGLCRYNKSGKFNVPFGQQPKPYRPIPEMRHFHKVAQNAVFLHQDFQKTMQEARPGDIIYCDPPYAPLSSTADFTAYSAGGFDQALQGVLVEEAIACAKRGIPVLISNHDTPFVRALYQGASLISFKVPRFISCDSQNRKPVKEVLALFD